MNQEFVLIVKKYYDLVDNKKISSLLTLFAKNILYQRADRQIKGINNLKKFYETERRITGTHKVHSIISEKNIVAVRENL